MEEIQAKASRKGPKFQSRWLLGTSEKVITAYIQFRLDESNIALSTSGRFSRDWYWKSISSIWHDVLDSFRIFRPCETGALYSTDRTALQCPLIRNLTESGTFDFNKGSWRRLYMSLFVVSTQLVIELYCTRKVFPAFWLDESLPIFRISDSTLNDDCLVSNSLLYMVPIARLKWIVGNVFWRVTLVPSRLSYATSFFKYNL